MPVKLLPKLILIQTIPLVEHYFLQRHPQLRLGKGQLIDDWVLQNIIKDNVTLTDEVEGCESLIGVAVELLELLGNYVT